MYVPKRVVVFGASDTPFDGVRHYTLLAKLSQIITHVTK